MTSAPKPKNVKVFKGIICSGMVPTLEELFETYVRFKQLRPSTKDGYICSMRLVRDWSHKPANKITKDDVVERMIYVTQQNGPGSANKLFRTLRALYNFAINYYENSDGTPVIAYNPINKVSDLKIWNKLERRQTIILKNQLPGWLRGVFKIEFPATRDMVLFLWLTGCRVGEARLLTWDQVDMDGGFVTFKAETTKTGKTCTIPICQFLRDLLRHRHEVRPSNNEYVFPSDVPMKPLTNNYGSYRRMCKKLGLVWKFHDLRRGFITRACALGLSDLVIKRLVNHAQSNNVTAGYAVLDANDLRPAVEIIANEFLKLADYQHDQCDHVKVKALQKYAPYERPAIGYSIDLGGLTVSLALSGSQSLADSH